MAVVVTASTKLKDICVYLDQGLVSMEQVNILFAGFMSCLCTVEVRFTK